MFKETDTRIGTLRIRTKADAPDRPALQRRLSYLLNTVDFRVPGISPTGILIVRHLDDPLPGKLSPHEPAHKANPAWEQALKNSMQKKYHTASRPVRGYIPPDAETVFFTDEGEMLAALALDISRGLAFNHWWWNVILRNMQIPPEPGLKTFLCREITLLPAILHHLAEWQTAPVVVEKLSSEGALTVLRALVQAFHLAELQAPAFYSYTENLEPPTQANDPDFAFAGEPLEKGDESIRKDFAESPAHTSAADLSLPGMESPWRQLFAAYGFPSSIPAEHTALLGVGLTLFHGPAKVRTAAFIAAFHRWWRYRQWLKQHSPQSPAPARKEPLNLNQPVMEAPAHGAVPTAPTFSSVPSVSSVANVSYMSYESYVAPETGAPFREKQETPALANIRFEDPAETQIQPGTFSKKEWAEAGVETQLGGVFYLINLAERLNLLARFHESRGQEGETGPWAMLEILAKALLADRYPDLETDPLWHALGELDGREPGIPPETLFPQACRWLEEELPGIRAFLHDIFLHNLMGPTLPTAGTAEPGKTMLLYPARVYITSTHVDIVMSLEDISLPIRQAGLDRDPGWMPEYARIILFHFV